MLKWNLKATISGMSEGDSFFIPCLACEGIQNHVRKLGKDFGYNLRTRRVIEDFTKGLRVWRVG